jgi:hypothetical protein
MTLWANMLNLKPRFVHNADGCPLMLVIFELDEIALTSYQTWMSLKKGRDGKEELGW